MTGLLLGEVYEEAPGNRGPTDSDWGVSATVTENHSGILTLGKRAVSRNRFPRRNFLVYRLLHRLGDLALAPSWKNINCRANGTRRSKFAVRIQL